MNKKGQALVEFIIILPIMILLVFCVVDFGRVISEKSSLESVASDAVTLYQNGLLADEVTNVLTKKYKNIKLNYEIKDEYITINVSKKIKPITPGLSYMPVKVFDINVSRVIKNE